LIRIQKTLILAGMTFGMDFGLLRVHQSLGFRDERLAPDGLLHYLVRIAYYLPA